VRQALEPLALPERPAQLPLPESVLARSP